MGRDHPLDDEADSHATLRGWMYLPGELTSALARSQLLRLVETTARSQRNTARSGERLARLPGVEPPRVPPDRPHIFHKYRVRLDPERAGLRLGPAGAERPRARSAARRRCLGRPLAHQTTRMVDERRAILEDEAQEGASSATAQHPRAGQ